MFEKLIDTRSQKKQSSFRRNLKIYWENLDCKPAL